MTPAHILVSALTSAAIAFLIEASAFLQVKTTERALQARPATRHAAISRDPNGRRRPRSITTEDYLWPFGRPAEENLDPQTAGAPALPQTAVAPACHPARHAAATDATSRTADDTHVMQRVT